jgi:hypothetical protein
MLANSGLSMEAKDTSITDNKWFYQDKPKKDLAVLTMATGRVSLILVIFLRIKTEAVVSTLLLMMLITLVVFLAQSKTANIEIDREKAAVIKTTNYRVFTVRKKYPLGEFSWESC